MTKRKEKSRTPRVAVLVSSDPSDIYFANRLASSADVAAIVVEKEGNPGSGRRLTGAFRYLFNPGRIGKRLADEIRMRRHARRVENIVKEGFGPDGLGIRVPEGVKVLYTEDINGLETVDFIRAASPDAMAVCGTSILGKSVLGLAPSGALNLHGGLSQWYRGVWTTLWAVYNEEPQFVGCTVHYISRGIDDGDIVYQGRPEIEADDNHETLYVKVVKLGTALMIKALEDMANGSIRACPLKKKGRLYHRKMVTPEILDSTWKKVDAGVIRNYVSRAHPPVEVPLIGGSVAINGKISRGAV